MTSLTLMTQIEQQLLPETGKMLKENEVGPRRFRNFSVLRKTTQYR